VVKSSDFLFILIFVTSIQEEHKRNIYKYLFLEENMEIIKDIKPRRDNSAYVAAPFDEGKKALEKANYRIISLQENARLRMQEGKSSYISQYGNWTREGIVYVSNKGKFLTKNSPIMTNAKKATDCHRNGEDFYLTDEQVEQALVDSVELSVKSVPTNRFGDCDITVYAFGEDAKKYGEFLKEVGIDSMPIWTADLENKPFARQMWFHGIGCGFRSVLNGEDRDLKYIRVRGVCESSEGTAPKNLENYIFRRKYVNNSRK